MADRGQNLQTARLREFIRGRIGQLDHTWLTQVARFINNANDQNAVGDKKRPPPSVCVAEITARSGTTNATYTAEMKRWPWYSVTTATPLFRLFDTADVTYNAATVGSQCILIVDDEQTVSLFIVPETIDVTACT